MNGEVPSISEDSVTYHHSRNCGFYFVFEIRVNGDWQSQKQSSKAGTVPFTPTPGTRDLSLCRSLL